MRILTLCLPLLLAACGDTGLGATTTPPMPQTPAPSTPPPVAATPKTACEQAFAELHRKPQVLTTAGVVESVQTGAAGAC